MRGGISRAAFQIAQARKEGHPVQFIDCGDGLFSDPVIPTEAVGQQERKAKALSEAWKAMGLTLRAPGSLDDVRGTPFHRALGLPEISQDGFEVHDGIGVLNASTAARARTLALEAKKGGARFVVALVPLPFEQLLRDSLGAQNVDLFISARSKDAFSAEESRLSLGKNKVAQIQSKGRSLLRVDVSFRGDGEVEWLKGDQERDRELNGLDERVELLRAQLNEPMLSEELKALRKAKLEDIIERREHLAAIALPVPQAHNAATARFIPLESNFPQDSTVQGIEKAYDIDVGLLNVQWAKEHGEACPQATTERRGFVGSTTCATCHAGAARVFQKTKHAQAYASLVDVGKQHHLDCISCHVTGWRQPQGVCRIDQTQGREEVGCESCHGPGDAHVKQPSTTNTKRKVDTQTCRGCHDAENSPHFDYERYVEKIVAPGHGRP